MAFKRPEMIFLIGETLSSERSGHWEFVRMISFLLYRKSATHSIAPATHSIVQSLSIAKDKAVQADTGRKGQIQISSHRRAQSIVNKEAESVYPE